MPFPTTTALPTTSSVPLRAHPTDIPQLRPLGHETHKEDGDGRMSLSPCSMLHQWAVKVVHFYLSDIQVVNWKRYVHGC